MDGFQYPDPLQYAMEIHGYSERSTGELSGEEKREVERTAVREILGEDGGFDPGLEPEAGTMGRTIEKVNRRTSYASD